MYRPTQVVLWSGVILCCMKTGAAHDVQTELSQFVSKSLQYAQFVISDTHSLVHCMCR